MKRIIILISFCLFALTAFGQTAVVYNSDDPYSTCAAAIVQQKYSLTYILDVAASDSAAQVTWIATLDSLTAAYIVVDTTTLYTADRCQSSTYDSIDAYMYYGYSLQYLAATTSVTVPERTWDSCYTGIIPPLAVVFLSETDFCEDKFDVAAGTDSTVVKTNATGWTNNEFNTGYTFYITYGTNIGASTDISDTRAYTAGNADTLDVTTKFDAAVTSTSDGVILSTSQFNKWGFNDVYLYYAILIKIADISTSTAKNGWDKLLDDNNKLNTLRAGRSPAQDLVYLQSLLDAGKNIFDYLVEIGN